VTRPADDIPSPEVAHEDREEDVADPEDGAVEGALWSEPDEGVEELPTVTELETLPLDKLTPRNAERLFLRLLDLTTDVIYAKSYGLHGQDQDGIDVYGQLRSSPTGASPGAASPGRPHVTLQSKRVKEVNPSDITKAVTRFLEGRWAATSSQFYYATTYDLRDRHLEEPIAEATRCLGEHGIEFVPWGAEEVNELLRDQARLVERFFGRHWVEPFCGGDQLTELPTAELGPAEARQLRADLRSLYQAAFASFASLSPRNAQGAAEPFVIFDVLEHPDRVTTAWARLSHATHEQHGDNELEQTPENPRTEGSATVSASALAKPRRSLRSVRALLENRRSEAGISGTVRADEWLTHADRNLLVGLPGAGKSSLLRFITIDLLAADPQSAALQRAYGDRLPVWLPFGYLCNHLDDDDANSLTSAVKAWLTNHGRADLYPVVQKAMADERLLLLIDGVDEWPTEASANTALGVIETFLGHRNATAFLTSRPYAVDRLPFNLTWHRADMAPLDSDQQRRVAQQYLIPPDVTTSHATATDASSPDSTANDSTRARMWSAASVDPFLDQLADVTELSELTRTPLLLALLAMTWRGEALPPRRFDLYRLIVSMLVDTHPKMRARAARAATHQLTNSEFRSLIQAVAYRLKADETPQPVPASTMRKLLADALADDDIIGLPEDEARKMAREAMEMAEDEFGLLVPQGAGHVGFVHRVIGDHLAGCHLAELDPTQQQAQFNTRHAEPTWTDVLLAALNAQTSPHAVAHTLEGIFTDLDQQGGEWPASITRHQDAWRFTAQALAADAKLAPRKARVLLDQLVREVETSPNLTYRADLLTALTQTATTVPHWRHLEPTFKRWLDATRPYPAPAMLTLGRLPIDDERARNILFHGLHHADANVRSSAVDAYATRFGNRATPATGGEPEPAPVDPLLIELIANAPDARTQSAALTALTGGWPEAPETLEHLEWARNTPKTNLRTVALYAVAKSDPDRRLRELFSHDEYDFVLSHLYTEHEFIDDHDWTGLNTVLVIRLVTEATQPERDEIADFAVRTLRQHPMTGGDRSVCWQLACGPLAGYDSLREWAIGELEDSNSLAPLIIYNLDQMPSQWTDHPALQEAIWARLNGPDPWHGWSDHPELLTRALPADRARTALLNALDTFRPIRTVRELVRRFRDDAAVRAELDTRFADDRQAPKIAPVAVDYLGPVDGFERIFSLLQARNATNPSRSSEEHVVLGYSVAESWHLFRQAVAGEPSPIEPATAAEVLDRYDEDDVAAACMAVPTDGLGWNIADTINTWPNKTIDYTLAELRTNSHILHGISDTTQSAALAAHAREPGPRSSEVIELALSQMTPLPAELREVAVHELAQAAIAPAKLLEIAATWASDPDDGVRRTAAVGITQAFIRARTGATEPAELSAWRDTIGGKLCAYGPTYEEDRQIAWICMLLLGEPELLDGVVETIGDPTPPGVRLTDIFGTTDDLLVELIARHWTALRTQLGENLLARLGGSRKRDAPDDVPVLRALAEAAPTSPEIAALLQERIAEEKTDHGASDTENMLNTAPAGIDYRIHEQGRTLENLQRILQRAGEDPNDIDRYGLRERWAFTHLLESWDCGLAELEAALREAGEADIDEWSGLEEGALARAAYVMLFPAHEWTHSQLASMQAWFDSPANERDQRGPATWLEATTLTFMATPADVLPVLLPRLFHPPRFERVKEPVWKSTWPLLRRLEADPQAVQALTGALDGSVPAATSSLFETLAWATSPPEHESARRVFLTARALQFAGELTPTGLETSLAVLAAVDPRVLVVDPFVDITGPLRVLGTSLTESR
jgi:hypothetical protein